MIFIRIWFKLVLMWHGYCPEHGLKRYSWSENNHQKHGYGKRYFGKRCNSCMDRSDAKGSTKDEKKQHRLERAIEALKPKEEQWQTVNKK